MQPTISTYLATVGQGRLPCKAQPCYDLDDGLSVFFAQDIPISDYWEHSNRRSTALHVVHVLSGGDGPCVRLLPIPSAVQGSSGAVSEKWTGLHADCCSTGKAILSKVDGNDRELLFVPALALEASGVRVPIFWGYCLPCGWVAVGSRLIDNSRLAVVFDLDETLLLASSMKLLELRYQSAYNKRQNIGKDLEKGCTSEADKLSKSSAYNKALREEELISIDMGLLRRYAATDSVEIEGQEYHCNDEVVQHDNGTTFTRPVIHLPKYGIILTRIDPYRKETSMLLRPRPGWEALRAYLCGEHDSAPSGRPKLRFEVYVCTTAERGYALEAWRLLDRTGVMIPPKMRERRIVCVPSAKKKNLLQVLTGGEPAARPPGWSSWHRIPLAIVIDDRLDVWDEASRAQVLMILPYFYYKQEVVSEEQVEQRVEVTLSMTSAMELERVKQVLVSVRATTYYDINEVLRARSDELVHRGVSEALQSADPLNVLPSISTVDKILADNASTPPFMMPGEAAAALGVFGTGSAAGQRLMETGDTVDATPSHRVASGANAQAPNIGGRLQRQQPPIPSEPTPSANASPVRDPRLQVNRQQGPSANDVAEVSAQDLPPGAKDDTSPADLNVPSSLDMSATGGEAFNAGLEPARAALERQTIGEGKGGHCGSAGSAPVDSRQRPGGGVSNTAGGGSGGSGSGVQALMSGAVADRWLMAARSHAQQRQPNQVPNPATQDPSLLEELPPVNPLHPQALHGNVQADGAMAAFGSTQIQLPSKSIGGEQALALLPSVSSSPPGPLIDSQAQPATSATEAAPGQLLVAPTTPRHYTNDEHGAHGGHDDAGQGPGGGHVTCYAHSSPGSAFTQSGIAAELVAPLRPPTNYNPVGASLPSVSLHLRPPRPYSNAGMLPAAGSPDLTRELRQLAQATGMMVCEGAASEVDSTGNHVDGQPTIQQALAAIGTALGSGNLQLGTSSEPMQAVQLSPAMRPTITSGLHPAHQLAARLPPALQDPHAPLLSGGGNHSVSGSCSSIIASAAAAAAALGSSSSSSNVVGEDQAAAAALLQSILPAARRSDDGTHVGAMLEGADAGMDSAGLLQAMLNQMPERRTSSAGPSPSPSQQPALPERKRPLSPAPNDHDSRAFGAGLPFPGQSSRSGDGSMPASGDGETGRPTKRLATALEKLTGDSQAAQHYLARDQLLHTPPQPQDFVAQHDQDRSIVQELEQRPPHQPPPLLQAPPTYHRPPPHAPQPQQLPYPGPPRSIQGLSQGPLVTQMGQAPMGQRPPQAFYQYQAPPPPPPRIGPPNSQQQQQALAMQDAPQQQSLQHGNPVSQLGQHQHRGVLANPQPQWASHPPTHQEHNALAQASPQARPAAGPVFQHQHGFVQGPAASGSAMPMLSGGSVQHLSRGPLMPIDIGVGTPSGRPLGLVGSQLISGQLVQGQGPTQGLAARPRPVTPRPTSAPAQALGHMAGPGQLTQPGQPGTMVLLMDAAGGLRLVSSEEAQRERALEAQRQRQDVVQHQLIQQQPQPQSFGAGPSAAQPLHGASHGPAQQNTGPMALPSASPQMPFLAVRNADGSISLVQAGTPQQLQLPLGAVPGMPPGFVRQGFWRP